MRFLHTGKIVITRALKKGIAAEGQKRICNGYKEISASFHQDFYSLLPQAKQQLLEHIVLSRILHIFILDPVQICLFLSCIAGKYHLSNKAL